MGLTKKPPPCVRFVAAFASVESVLDLVWDRLQGVWGPIACLSLPFDFVESEYYLKTMTPPRGGLIEGESGLKKQLAIFANPYDPALLADDKLESNRWEEAWGAEFTACKLFPASVARPINIDPGYLSMTKLVLASTKNREHRIYLRDGIYAEVTLAFRTQAWVPLDWTYADYQRADVIEFLTMGHKLFLQGVSRGES